MIQINSFKGGQSNDKNAGQEGGFWNAKNINYRTNMAYVELAKGATTAFSIANTNIPRAMNFGANGGTVASDIAVFTSNGIYTSAGQQSSVTGIINIIEANSVKYFVTSNKIYSYTTLSSTTLLDTFTRTTDTRPMLNFAGDIIIGDGNQVAKWPKTGGALIEYVSGSSTDLIGDLDGNVQALTSIGPNVYVWCQNGMNTNLYIWDGLTNAFSEKIVYIDKSVQNVALLGNTHYWWQSKTDASIKEVLVGNSYVPQVFVKTVFPELPLNSNENDEKNKMAICVGNSAYINAIETISDIVYLPGVGRIFGFGRYFPGDKISFNTEFTFTGTFVNCMASGGLSGSGIDAGGFLAFAVLNGSNYDIKIINLGQDGSTPSPTFATSGEIESMEYIATNFAKGEQDVKLTVPFDLPTSACSIKVYYKNDRASSYTLAKEILTSEFGTGYNVAEITSGYAGKWRTKQFKFELITSDTTVSPKLYVGITNETLESGKIK